MLTNYELTDVKTDVMSSIITDFAYGAVGSGSTTPTASATGLNEEGLRVARQEYVQLASDIIVSMFINSGQFNGTSINEMGWFTPASGSTARQTALVSTVQKTSDKEVWIDTKINVSVTQT